MARQRARAWGATALAIAGIVALIGGAGPFHWFTGDGVSPVDQLVESPASTVSPRPTQSATPYPRGVSDDDRDHHNSFEHERREHSNED